MRILQIYSVNEDDYGKYSCKADNRYGSALEHMELYESTVPICPPVCGETDLNAASPGGLLNKVLLLAPAAFFLRL